MVTYSKEVLWIDFELVQDLLGPKGQKIYDNLDSGLKVNMYYDYELRCPGRTGKREQ